MLAMRFSVGSTPEANSAPPATKAVASGNRIMMRFPWSMRTMRDDAGSRSRVLLNCQRKLLFAFMRRSNWTISTVRLVGAWIWDGAWPGLDSPC